jgi:diguanylate cyclase (GGDEF)-like protein
MPSFAAETNRTVRFDRTDLGQGSSQQEQKHSLLVCIQGLEVGKPFELVLTETIVGRTPSAGLVLANSQISRQHAKILWMNGHHVLEDLNSANGTFVGGVRITRQRLNAGDIVQFGSSFAFRYSIMDDTEKSLMEQLYQSSVLDALTGAYNREYFNSVLSTELKQSKTTSSALSLLLLDIDHFKKINDTYGHPAGDAVLIELVERLRLRLRPSDVLCRYGGEEFAVILRATELDDAVHLAERFRRAVCKQKFAHANQCFAVTVSIGCASLACCGDDSTAEALTAAADRRLYTGKKTGRDRVVHTD